eukprot:SAG22_NODE_984_length_6161_cov_19.034807_2_plen_65_part_00
MPCALPLQLHAWLGCGDTAVAVLMRAAMGVVTTDGIHHDHAKSERSFVPEHLFVGPVELGTCTV